MQIPKQYNQLMPYLIIPNAYQFMAFAKEVFGAVEQMIVPRSEGIIMHGELRIGEAVIMFADITNEYSARPAGLFIYVQNVDETYKKAISLGAISTIEPIKMDYGYSCGFKDAFGNEWWPVQGD